MNEALISQFIDDELDLQEKIDFVQQVHENRQAKDAAIGLLQQEQLLRAPVAEHFPPARVPAATPLRPRFRLPWIPFASGLAVAAMLILSVYLAMPQREMVAQSITHRFVIYAPNVSTVGISGTFTGWDVLPLERMGQSGYWETRLTLPQGEHRFSYIMEGGRRVPDPTVLMKEHDDFGGVNSILQVTPTRT